MNKFKIIIFTILVFNVSLLSQNRVSNIFLLEPGMRWETLGTSGNSGHFITNPEQLSGSNPTQILNWNTSHAALSYQYDTELKEAWIADIGYKPAERYFPQSLSLIYPLNQFTLGITASQVYNGQTVFKPIPVTTIENPEGTGETITARQETNLYKLGLVGASEINKNLKLGLKINFHLLNHEEKFFRTNASLTGYGFNFLAGLAYATEFQSNRMEFSLYYKSKLKISDRLKLNSANLVEADLDPETRGNQVYGTMQDSYPFELQLPQQLSFGFKTELSEINHFIFDITWKNWKNINREFNDCLDIGAYYGHYFGKTDLSLGIYLADSYYNDEVKYIFDSTAGTKGIFLVAGAGFNFPWFYLDFSVADGQLFSGDWRKQTIFKSAISLSF